MRRASQAVALNLCEVAETLSFPTRDLLILSPEADREGLDAFVKSLPAGGCLAGTFDALAQELTGMTRGSYRVIPVAELQPEEREKMGPLPCIMQGRDPGFGTHWIGWMPGAAALRKGAFVHVPLWNLCREMECLAREARITREEPWVVIAVAWGEERFYYGPLQPRDGNEEPVALRDDLFSRAQVEEFFYFVWPAENHPLGPLVDLDEVVVLVGSAPEELTVFVGRDVRWKFVKVPLKGVEEHGGRLRFDLAMPLQELESMLLALQGRRFERPAHLSRPDR